MNDVKKKVGTIQGPQSMEEALRSNVKRQAINDEMVIWRKNDKRTRSPYHLEKRLWNVNGYTHPSKELMAPWKDTRPAWWQPQSDGIDYFTTFAPVSKMNPGHFRLSWEPT